MQEKIIYLAFTSPKHLGVRKKILTQTEIWETTGINVQIVYDKYDAGNFIKLLNRYRILILYFVLRKDKQARIYLRQTACLPFFSLITRFRAFSYEVNADISKEVATLTLLKRIFLTIFRDKLIDNASKVFFVSDEISKRYIRSGQKAYVFPNSLPSFPITKILPRSNKIVFVGSDQYAWQGVDILFSLIKKMPDFEFHIVGDICGLESNNVIFHGTMSGNEYESLMAEMDYSIGTLAFYRSGLTEGSPLNVRDYVK